MPIDKNRCATIVKKLDITKISGASWKDRKSWLEALKKFLETETVPTMTLPQTTTTTIGIKLALDQRKNQNMLTHPVRHVKKKPLYGERLFLSQCSQHTVFLE